MSRPSAGRQNPAGGGVLGGLFYDGDSGIGGAGVLLDGGEEQRLIHQLIGGAAVVARCNAEPRDLIEPGDGEVIRQGEYAEQQQGGGEDDADAGGAFCGKRTDDEIQAGQHHEAAERGVDAAPTAFGGEDGQGGDDDEQPEDGQQDADDPADPGFGGDLTVFRHGDGGFFDFLIHILAFPFSFDDFRDADPVELGQLDQHPEIGHIAARFPYLKILVMYECLHLLA